MLVNGNLTVTGTFPSSTAVAHADGTLRRIYGLAAPEAFYEDAGQGSITNGVGVVNLDPDFAALVLGDTYHIFLTPRGDCNGLYISGQTSNGFEVRELRAGTSSVGFSCRVLARPKDNPPPRMDRVAIPQAPAQSKLDRLAPLDVGAALRGDVHVPDSVGNGSGGSVRPLGASGSRDIP